MGAPSNPVSIGKDEAVSSKHFFGAFHSTRPPGKKGGIGWVGKHSKKVWGVPPALKTVNLFQGKSLRYS